MRDRGHSAAGVRSPAWPGLVTLVLAAGLLLGTVDFHSLIHHRQNLAEEALAAEHPRPAHLDTARSSHELPCLGCAAGLKSHGRPAEAARVPAAPDDLGFLAVETSTADPGRLPYRLPPSRAPPLS